MSDIHDIVIVGAGQGGLSVSYYLAEARIDHRVVDRGGIAHAWKANRWESFCLVTPNWSVNLPGHPYRGNDPDGFMPRDDFVAYMTDWANSFGAPVEPGVNVLRVHRHDGYFHLSTDQGVIRARMVVIATATYQHPKIPAIAGDLPAEIHQLHAEQYKSPDQAPDGAVLVVGSGQTGCQIVEDFLRDGRRVYLSVARTGRLPRRYRGRDCLYWQRDMKLLDRTPDMLDSPADRFLGDPHLTGRDGGATVSLHNFRQRGVTLLGRLTGASDTRLRFAGDLADNIRFADDFAANFMKLVDDFVDAQRIDAPQPTADELDGGPVSGAPDAETYPTLDLRDSGISTIVWATGFTFDFSWIDDLEVDAFGYPVTDKGASSLEGLYFCGLNWMTRRKSGILYGVKEDARAVAQRLISKLEHDITPKRATG